METRLASGATILRPRVVLEAYSQCGSQDLLVSFWESQQDAERFGETQSNTADYQTFGMSILTVKLQDVWQQKNVKADRDVRETSA